jgi:Rrf2 family protein
MRISSKGEYGIRALFDLAQHYGQGLIQSDEIARRQGIPVNYLNQMLITLRKAGLIESQRGPQGGHTLARAPEQINLLEALVALEGSLIIHEATREDGTALQSHDSDFIHEVWENLRATIEHTLQGVTLEDLCERKRQRTGHMMYYI